MLRMRAIGPGLLVTAAFVGPGTVTTATLAGASFGFALLWAVAFSTLATVVLQEMSARLGIVSRMGLGEALRSSFNSPAARTLALLLVVVAIVFGNAAFQAGNIAGAAIGLEAATGLPRGFLAAAIAMVAAGMLFTGSYRRLERILIALVVLMSLGFIATAVAVRPALSGLAAGLVPSIPANSGFTVLALIGTTVVPYNLFLHASIVRKKWPDTFPTDEALREARIDAFASIVLGGVVTASILVVAAAFFRRGMNIQSADDMAAQLRPLLGYAGEYLFLLGLIAAGTTSAVTAPLAAAYAACGAFGWPQVPTSARFRAVWILVLLTGALFAILGRSPVEMIRLAQAANGLLLPVVAVFLVYVVNRRALMGDYANRVGMNAAAVAVILIASLLGLNMLAKAFRLLGG